MTLQLSAFWCFFAAGSWEKDTENRAAVTSLRFFLFRDDFNTEERLQECRQLLLLIMLLVGCIRWNSCNLSATVLMDSLSKGSNSHTRIILILFYLLIMLVLFLLYCCTKKSKWHGLYFFRENVESSS